MIKYLNFKMFGVLSIILIMIMIIPSCSKQEMKGIRSSSQLATQDEVVMNAPLKPTLNTASDIFKLKVSQEPKPMDILIVVDNNAVSSMVQYQRVLAEQLEPLVEFLGKNTSDWRIAVTSSTPKSDLSGIIHKECVELDEQGMPNIITSKDYAEAKNDPEKMLELKQKFSAIIRGVGSEDTVKYSEGLFKVLEAMDLVNLDTYKKVKKLDPSYSIENEKVFSKEGYNGCDGKYKWFRDEASLSVVILSDEDQCALSSSWHKIPACKTSYGLYFRRETNMDRVSWRGGANGFYLDALADNQKIEEFLTKSANIGLLQEEGFSFKDLEDGYLNNKDIPKNERCLSMSKESIGGNKIYSFYFGQTSCPNRALRSQALVSSYDLGMVDRASSSRIFLNYISTLNKDVKVYGILHPKPDDPELHAYLKDMGDGVDNQYRVKLSQLAGIDPSWVYRDVIEKLGNFQVGNILRGCARRYVEDECKEVCGGVLEKSDSYKTGECLSCTKKWRSYNDSCRDINQDAYVGILEDISKNISMHMKVKKVSLPTSLPENILDVSLGVLDKSSNFIEMKKLELGKNIVLKSSGFELDDKEDIGSYTHIKITYSTVK